MTYHEKVVNLDFSDTMNFAEIARDWNPLHLDISHAKQNGFELPICHGAMTSSLFSGRLTEMFGPNTLYVDQYTKFIKPIPVGSKVKIVLSEPQLVEKGRTKVKTEAYVDICPHNFDEQWELAVVGHATIIPGNATA
jgi:3-hydroxybutyryl-CoA dehydratase